MTRAKNIQEALKRGVFDGPDLLVDRHKLTRKLWLWRLLALVLFIVSLGIAASHDQHGSHVARVSVDGIILEDSRRSQLLADLAADDAVRAVIVQINSPGGSLVGGESLYYDMLALSEKKMVVALFGTLGTSAAYMSALGANTIFARAGTITGSVGVVLQSVQVNDLLDKVGVQFEIFKSGDLKAVPNPVERITPAVRQHVQTMIDQSYEFFFNTVRQRRQLSDERLAVVADGRAILGSEAFENGLVDGIGGHREAIAWLDRQLPDDDIANLPVRDARFKPDRGAYWMNFMASWLWNEGGSMEHMPSLTSTGLVSTWTP